MRTLICTTMLACAAAAALPIAAQRAVGGDAVAPGRTQPVYTAKGELVRPRDYREWVFLSSGLGMTYGPAQTASNPATQASANAARAPMFDNVFVTRSAYRAFMESGRWPDGTMFILEIRRSLENVSISSGGRTQGDVAFIEAAVKDVQRFKDTGGWAYFNFGGGEKAGRRRCAAAGIGQLLHLPRDEHRGREHLRAVLSRPARRGTQARNA